MDKYIGEPIIMSTTDFNGNTVTRATQLNRYAFDTEFNWDGHYLQLLSIGIVSVEDPARTYYAQFVEPDYDKIFGWVKDNVIPRMAKCLTGGVKNFHHKGSCNDLHCPWRTKQEAKREILNFIGETEGNKPEFWAYYSDWDWVALCGLYGSMSGLPKGWPMVCYDLRQLLDFTGNEDVKQEDGEDDHNALADAKWVVGTLKLYDTRQVKLVPSLGTGKVQETGTNSGKLRLQ